MLKSEERKIGAFRVRMEPMHLLDEHAVSVYRGKILQKPQFFKDENSARVFYRALTEQKNDQFVRSWLSTGKGYKEFCSRCKNRLRK
jgi:hypothetical protein